MQQRTNSSIWNNYHLPSEHPNAPKGKKKIHRVGVGRAKERKERRETGAGGQSTLWMIERGLCS